MTDPTARPTTAIDREALAAEVRGLELAECHCGPSFTGRGRHEPECRFEDDAYVRDRILELIAAAPVVNGAQARKDELRAAVEALVTVQVPMTYGSSKFVLRSAVLRLLSGEPEAGS